MKRWLEDVVVWFAGVMCVVIPISIKVSFATTGIFEGFWHGVWQWVLIWLGINVLFKLKERGWFSN